MKKVLIVLVSLLLIVPGISSCGTPDREPSDGGSAPVGITWETYENYAIFTFHEFNGDGKHSFKLERYGLGEGEIYYYVDLSEGTVDIKYDTGWQDKALDLVTASAEDKMPITGSGGYVEDSEVNIVFDISGPVSGEMFIAFVPEILEAIHKDIHLHEHTYRWEVTEGSHKRIYTCGCGGEAQREPDPHLDSDGDGYCDECTTPFQAKLPPDEIYHYLRDVSGAEWLKSILPENVTQVKTVLQYNGVQPGSLTTRESSTHPEAIFHMIDSYYHLESDPISKEDAMFEGGSSFSVSFYLEDGTKQELLIQNGIYRDSNGDYWKLKHIPTLRDHVYSAKDPDVLSDSFSFVTYQDSGTVYQYQDENTESRLELGALSGIGKLEFVECVETVSTVPTHCIETEFGMIQVYNETGFSVREQYYNLINGDFYQMFSDAK